MPASPIRKNHDQFKDAEARIRALTREVGTLREDLRRESKRRDRAIELAKQNEELHRTSSARVQELQYTNKRLSAELASAHEAGQTAAERDRRSLRFLREGLAAVELAVSDRAVQGKQLVRMAFEFLAPLRQILKGLPSGLEMQMAVMLAEVTKVLSHLEQILVGEQDDAGKSAQRRPKDTVVTQQLQGLSHNLEKAEFQDQILELRSQVQNLRSSAEQAAAETVKDKDASCSHAHTFEAGQSPIPTSALNRLEEDYLEQKKQNEMLRGEVVELRRRLQMQEVQSHQHFVNELHATSRQAEEAVSSLQQQLSGAMVSKVNLEQENNMLHSKVQELQSNLDDQKKRIQALQGTMSAQNEDVRSALKLISASNRDALQAIPQSQKAIIQQYNSSSSIQSSSLAPVAKVPISYFETSLAAGKPGYVAEESGRRPAVGHSENIQPGNKFLRGLTEEANGKTWAGISNSSEAATRPVVTDPNSLIRSGFQHGRSSGQTSSFMSNIGIVGRGQGSLNTSDVERDLRSISGVSVLHGNSSLRYGAD